MYGPEGWDPDKLAYNGWPLVIAPTDGCTLTVIVLSNGSVALSISLNVAVKVA